MSSADEPHAFISYVHEDSDAVDGLEAALVAAGIKVWRDKNNLGPGDDWKRVIRQAIKGNALVFIPCFSKAANDKEKSVMREEIYFAIEEYKLRKPDRPWILSVRFDECDVPDLDLVSGKTLRSLNWSNLHGGTYGAEIVKLTDRVKSLLSTAGGSGTGAVSSAGSSAAAPAAGPTSAAVSAAVSGASDPVRGSLLAGAVRDAAVDPAHMASGDLQVRGEARKVVEALRDRTRFPTDLRPDAAQHLERLQAVTDLTRPLIEAAVSLGAYGQASQTRLATDVVNSLARAGIDPGGGGSRALLKYFTLPASLVMQAGVLAAVANQNPAMVQAFIVKPETTTNNGVLPVHELISPWQPYIDELRIADLYAKTLNGRSPDPAAYDVPSTGGEYYMAPQVALNVLLKPFMLDYTIDDVGYTDLYGRMEVLVGAVVYDACGPDGLNLKYHYASDWVGQHVVGERYGQPLADRLLAEAKADGPGWWPLVGDALFGGNPDRAQAALTEYAKAAEESRKRFR